VTRLRALILLLACSCVDVEQKLDVRDGGAVTFDWRLGLRNRLLLNKKADDPAWIAKANEAAPGYVTARSERDAERTWYIVQANLPSVATYQQFREAFGAAFREHYQSAAAWMLPPEVVWDDDGLRVSVHAKPTGTSREEPEATSADHWRLTVDLPGEPTGLPPDRKEGETWVWERPTLGVLRDGIDIDVRVHASPTPWWSIAGLVASALGTVLVTGAILLVRARVR
jgi:hypothetical protein